MSIYTLHYDDNCPVCKSFVKLLRNKIRSNTIIFKPSTDNSLQEFKLSIDGTAYYHKEAIYKLSEKYPEIGNFFWMLPPSYRQKAVSKLYYFGRWMRKWFYRSCNCNKKSASFI